MNFKLRRSYNTWFIKSKNVRSPECIWCYDIFLNSLSKGLKIKNFNSFYFKDFSKWMLLNKIILELLCIINVPLYLVRENKLKGNQISSFESCYKDPSDFLYCVSKNLSNLSSAKNSGSSAYRHLNSHILKVVRYSRILLSVNFL